MYNNNNNKFAPAKQENYDLTNELFELNPRQEPKAMANNSNYNMNNNHQHLQQQLFQPPKQQRLANPSPKQPA